MIDLKLILMAGGLVLWQAPFDGHAARLNEVGKWVFIIAYAIWLWQR